MMHLNLWYVVSSTQSEAFQTNRDHNHVNALIFSLVSVFTDIEPETAAVKLED